MYTFPITRGVFKLLSLLDIKEITWQVITTR